MSGPTTDFGTVSEFERVVGLCRRTGHFLDLKVPFGRQPEERTLGQENVLGELAGRDKRGELRLNRIQHALRAERHPFKGFA